MGHRVKRGDQSWTWRDENDKRVIACIGFVAAIGSWIFTSKSRWKSRGKPTGRRRDLLPLPPLEIWPSCFDQERIPTETCLAMANYVIASINFLAVNFNADRIVPCGSVAPTIAQQASHNHVACRVARY